MKNINIKVSNIQINKSLKELIILTLIFVSSSLISISQGFDWQQGGRYPYEIPVFYVGINTSYNVNNHYGNFNFKEDFIECCKFTNGSGNGYRFGFIGEYWYDATTALSATIDYSETSGNFSIRSVLPTRTGDFISDYIYESSIKNINLELLARRRIKLSHFSYGAGLKFSYLINENNQYSEQSISNNVPFEKRIIASGTINDLNSLTISPVIFLSYDVSLGVGYYVSPNLSLSYNIISLIEDEAWRKLSFSFGIRILRNL